MSPAGHLCLLFASPTHLSHRLNPHKSLQNKTLSSSRGFLGFGSPLEQQAPRHPLSHRYRLASKHPAHCSAAFWDVPAASPYSTCQHFSLLSPGGHRKRMSVLGKQESPHWAPQDFSLCSANACVLWFVICLSPQPGFPCSPNSFLTDVGMFFLPGAKL